MIPLLLLILVISASLSAMERERIEDPMEVEIPFSFVSPLEEKKVNPLTTMSLASTVHLIESSVEFAHKADGLPIDKKNELKSALIRKHLILFYDIFKNLSKPQQITHSEEINDSDNGQVYLCKSGVYINSNPTSNTTTIRYLNEPKDPIRLNGFIQTLTQDEKFILVFNINNTNSPFSLYNVETGREIFSCRLENNNILIYEAESNIWTIVPHSADLKKQSDTTYVFLPGLQIAHFNKYMKNDRFLEYFLNSHSLKHSFTIRNDEKYAFLETNREMVIFDLHTMHYTKFPAGGFLSAMSTAGNLALRLPNATCTDIEVLDLTKLPDIAPVTILKSPCQQYTHVQNVAISADGTHAVVAYYDEPADGEPLIYHHFRTYVLYDTQTGKSTILNNGDYVDLQEITDYATEHIRFDDTGNLIIARDNVYFYNFEEIIPSSLTLEQISYIIQLGYLECPIFYSPAQEWFNNNFKDPQVKKAVVDYFRLSL